MPEKTVKSRLKKKCEMPFTCGILAGLAPDLRHTRAYPESGARTADFLPSFALGVVGSLAKSKAGVYLSQAASSYALQCAELVIVIKGSG